MIKPTTYVKIRMAMGRYGSGFALSRLDPTCLDTRPKKTRLLACPAYFNRYPFNPTRPDFFFLKDFFNQVLQIRSTWSSISRWIRSDQTTIIGHLAQLNPNKIWATVNLCVRIQFVGPVVAPCFRPNLIHAFAAV